MRRLQTNRIVAFNLNRWFTGRVGAFLNIWNKSVYLYSTQAWASALLRRSAKIMTTTLTYSAKNKESIYAVYLVWVKIRFCVILLILQPTLIRRCTVNSEWKAGALKMLFSISWIKHVNGETIGAVTINSLQSRFLNVGYDYVVIISGRNFFFCSARRSLLPFHRLTSGLQSRLQEAGFAIPSDQATVHHRTSGGSRIAERPAIFSCDIFNRVQSAGNGIFANVFRQ